MQNQADRIDEVLILTGPPGVGKTTIARALAESRERAVHLEADTFFDFIRSGYIEPWRAESREQNEVVMGIVAAVAIRYAGAGYFTVLDGIILPAWSLAPLRRSFEEAGLRSAYAVLRAPLALCESRAEGRAHKPLEKPEVIEQLWEDFSDLGGLESHAIEVGDLDPSQSAALVTRELESLRL